MKKCLLVLVGLLTLQSIGLTMAQQDTILVFEGHMNTTPWGSQIMKPCLPRIERLSSDFGGVIKVICGAGIDDEMQHCIKAATLLWEEKLYIPENVVLKFEKKELGAEAADFQAQVRYTSFPDAKTTYPNSYYQNFLTDDERVYDEDAIILINEDTDWEYSFNGKAVDKKNFTTAMLRAIAISLGFGSSVVNDVSHGIIFSIEGCFSPFDNLIVDSNNVRLNEMPNNGAASQELSSFVSEERVYCKTSANESFRLYTSRRFQGYNYLNYLYFDGDLMSYNTRTGDKIQQIDEIVLGVLRTIGWEEPESNLRIIAEGIDDTGIASSSQSYNFHAETTSGSIANYSWKYELLDNEMEFVTIKTGDSSDFSIDEIDDVTKYNKNINADIKGKISLTATTADGKKKSETFYVYFATEPTFVSVKVDAITPNPGTNFYSLDVVAFYTGADYLYVEQSEEFGILVNSHSYDEVYSIKLHFEHIHKDGKAWVDLELKNKIGKAHYTVEIPSQMNPDPIIEVTAESSISQVEVRDIEGRLLLQTENYEDVNCLSRGVYIIMTTYANGEKIIKKICK